MKKANVNSCDIYLESTVRFKSDKNIPYFLKEDPFQRYNILLGTFTPGQVQQWVVSVYWQDGTVAYMHLNIVHLFFSGRGTRKILHIQKEACEVLYLLHTMTRPTINIQSCTTCAGWIVSRQDIGTSRVFSGGLMLDPVFCQIRTSQNAPCYAFVLYFANCCSQN